MQVSKQIKWEAAHRLVHGYPGNCSQLHGHSYVATVTMQSTNNTLNYYGFVKDFNDMKVLKDWVDKNWDHGTFVCSQDQSLMSWLVDNNQRCFIFDNNPTAEIIGLQLISKARDLLDDSFSKVVIVKINETCSSEAIISKEDALLFNSPSPNKIDKCIPLS